MPNITAFDPTAHHIRFVGSMTTSDGVEYEFRAILDTGAPWTEFSDQFLHALGMIPKLDPNVSTKPNLQTQRYGRVIVPQVIVWDTRFMNYLYPSHTSKRTGALMH